MRSKFEERFANLLDENNIPYQYETDKFKFVPRPRTYTPDFVLIKADDTPMYIETKGFFKSADRSKTKRVKAHHPEMDLRFVFQNANNKLNKNSDTTYGCWCTNNGIPWAHSEMPDEWIKELKS